MPFHRRLASALPLRGKPFTHQPSAEQPSYHGLCQVRPLHKLILAAIMSALKVILRFQRPQLCRSQPTQLHAQSTSRPCRLRSMYTHGSECALLTGILSWVKFTHHSEWQGRLKKANIEYVLLAGSSVFLCEPCTFVC